MALLLHIHAMVALVTVPFVSPADELFAALDGHILLAADALWELRVVGVHDSGECMWVQCTLVQCTSAGSRQDAVTFRIGRFNGVEILARVSEWLSEREGSESPVAMQAPTI
jgi:hypothetical protein